MNEQILCVLQQTFGLTAFRPHQEEAIRDACAGRDLIVLLPTGSGKSLCYQLPGMLEDRLTVVVYPLLALINDQARQMSARNLPVTVYHGGISRAEKSQICAQLSYQRVTIGRNGTTALEIPLKWRFMLTTPETLTGDRQLLETLQTLCARGRLARFAIDECHCIHAWADDFRPSYLALGRLRDLFPTVPITALTATARRETQVAIHERLHLRHPAIHQGTYHRPNLQYLVRDKPGGGSKDPFYDTLYTLISRHHAGQCGIIYSFSRDSCHLLAEALTARRERASRPGTTRSDGLRDTRLTVGVYHAGLSDAERQEVQAAWVAGRYHVVVATIAFGLGIDKPDVRFVIHATPPTSLEAYSQETGRAGRDGLPATCYLFYSARDMAFLRRITKPHQAPSLTRFRQWVEDEMTCRVHALLTGLDERDESLERFMVPCRQCDVCQTWGRSTRRAVRREMTVDESEPPTIYIPLLEEG